MQAVKVLILTPGRKYIALLIFHRKFEISIVATLIYNKILNEIFLQDVLSVEAIIFHKITEFFSSTH